jgi:3-isopropylmalate dehydrogenase
MKVCVLPGDGIGPEVTCQALLVLREVCAAYGIALETEEALIGGVAIRETGSPFPEETRRACLDADAVFLGAVGTPEFDHLRPEERPEKGLLLLRQALGGFANLRPARAFPALMASSPLREEVFAGTDLLIVRELLGGLYFGEPRGLNIEREQAYNTMVYTVPEIERVARVAFIAARTRRGQVTSVDKANVLEVSQLWRQTVTWVGADYPDVTLEHQYVDSCAMSLVTNPSRFDVILMENLFGDILSDEAAVLTGSLGMLASATIGGPIDLYEPVHGSAPDLTGKDLANPLGAIASAALLLRYTAKNETAAAAIEESIQTVLEQGHRTMDIAHGGTVHMTSTAEMGELVANNAVEMENFRHAYHAV